MHALRFLIPLFTILVPFDGKPMSSFILSLDGCAEECVSYDFWSAIFRPVRRDWLR